LSIFDEKHSWENRASVSKAIRMAKVSAKGRFNLFWGLATSTIIPAVGVILVARLLSPPEYGIVAIAFDGSQPYHNIQRLKRKLRNNKVHSPIQL